MGSLCSSVKKVKPDNNNNNNSSSSNINNEINIVNVSSTVSEVQLLPPIRFIPYDKLKELSSFPRYPDNADICVNEDQIDRSKSLIIFISHCWLRGWEGATGWDGRPHPDNDKHEKFQLILEAVKHLRLSQTKTALVKETYLWIDYGCINQNADPAGELKQLDKIVQLCDLVLTVIADSYDNEWKSFKLSLLGSNLFEDYKAKSWYDGPYAYLNRCWCRVEMLFAANIPLCEDSAERVKNFSGGLAEAVKKNRRPHYLYGTYEKMMDITPQALEPLRNACFDKYNPLTGFITKKSDLRKISELVEELKPYIDANKAIVGYIGDRNEAGQMSGKGTYTFLNDDVYDGEFEDDKMSGSGTLTFANGDVYKGEFKDDKMSGQGRLFYANGDMYIGSFKDGKVCGKGKFIALTGTLRLFEISSDNFDGDSPEMWQVLKAVKNSIAEQEKDDVSNSENTES